MKRAFFIAIIVLLFFGLDAQAQKRSKKNTNPKNSRSVLSNQIGNKAIVIDDRLSLLLSAPSLFAAPVQRMRIGRSVVILEEKTADGVTFYKISAPPIRSGWVQSDAVAGTFRKDDDIRLVKLIQANEDFEQIQKIKIFLDLFPKSKLRPAVLLLLGDIMEETAQRVTKDASRKLDRREMAASGAPLHSFYLNYVSLDRYRKLGFGFLYNAETKTIHYDGASWDEIVTKFPDSNEVVEARKRIDELKGKMQRKAE